MRGSCTSRPIKALARPQRTPWEEAPARSSNPGKYGPIKRAMGEGRHGICGMLGGLTRRHDGGPVEGDLRQEPGVASRGGTCWWDVSWQWLPARNHPPPRHILHKDGMKFSHSQSDAPVCC